MLIHAITTALTLMLASQDAPVDREKQVLTDLGARARELCETRPRPANEELEACVQRRTTALVATHRTPAAALTAVGGPPGAPESSELGFPTLTQSMQSVSAAAAATEAAPEAPVRCRQETTRSQDGTSVSAQVVCGNSDSTDRQVSDMLNSMFPNND